jgi:hypothetical protein
MAPTPTRDDRVPIDGYDGLDARRLLGQLPSRSQAELASIDSYERSHQDRRAVLDKVRYLRREEPFGGYDRLDADEILAVLADADMRTLAAVRDYEAPRRARADVLARVAQLRNEKQVAQSPMPPAGPAMTGGYDPAGGFGGAVSTVGVMGLIGIAAALMLVSLGILVFLVLVAAHVFG